MPYIRFVLCALLVVITHASYAQSNLPFSLDYNQKNEFTDFLQPKSKIISEVRDAFLAKSWIKLRKLIAQGYEKSISIRDLQQLSKDLKNQPLKNALISFSNIAKLKDTKLSKKEILLFTLFIETELKNFTKKNDNYIDRKKSGLSKVVEFDPVTTLAFIHLGTKIGEGHQKIVTKSILYRLENPEIVANCQTSSYINREVNLMKRLRRKPGLVESYAFTQHRRGNKTFTSIFTKLYNAGSLQLVFEKHMRFSLKEKIGIALNIMKGINVLHKKHIIHRDLGARNYFVNIDKNKEGKREITAVVADFGRSHYFSDITKDKSVQGNKYYVAPEGFLQSKLSPKDYTYTDLYAVGLVFYRLMYHKTAPWVNVGMNRNESVSLHDRKNYALKKLKIFTDKKRDFFHNKRNSLNKAQKFLKVIFQLLHPNPKNRGTAQEHCKTLQDLYKSM